MRKTWGAHIGLLPILIFWLSNISLGDKKNFRLTSRLRTSRAEPNAVDSRTATLTQFNAAGSSIPNHKCIIHLLLLNLNKFVEYMIINMWSWTGLHICYVWWGRFKSWLPFLFSFFYSIHSTTITILSISH